MSEDKQSTALPERKTNSCAVSGEDQPHFPKRKTNSYAVSGEKHSHLIQAQNSC